MIGRPRFYSPILLLACAVLACAVLAGCTHTRVSTVAVPAGPTVARSGDVGVTDISEFAAQSRQLVLADNETFFLPLPATGNALPGYPPSVLAQQLAPQLVCLEVGVGADGEVMAALPITATAQCPVEVPGAQAAVDRRFLDAARDAVLGWRFDAAFRCEYPNDAARTRQDCSGGRETPQAVSLAYRFVFEQRDGRGSVRLSGGAE